LVLAIASAEAGDWAAAEQGVIDAQQRAPTILRQIQMKLAEPPAQGGGEVDDRTMLAACLSSETGLVCQ
jgi:hypothetical protein